MKIRKLTIENFRSLKHVTIPVDDLTILIGKNGTGKSAVLKAVDIFFTTNAKYDEDDFYDRNIGEPIKITVTFELTNEKEIEEFGKYVLEDGEKRYLKVMKKLEWPASRNNQKYYGFTKKIPEFVEVKNMKAEEMRKHYSEVLKAKYPDLPELPKKAPKAKILGILLDYEKKHPEYLREVPEEEQFFGYKEVGKGKINKQVKFLLIPAVKDVSDEAEYKKGSVIAEITNLLIENQIRSDPKIREVERQYKQSLSVLQMPGSNSKLLDALSREISQILQRFAPGTKALINWNLDEFQLPFPTLEILIEEDGFSVHIDRIGHGTQRALLFSLLQYLVEIKHRVIQTQESTLEEESTTPTILLVIEELELYQHPQRQKHLQKLFQSIKGSKFSNFDIQVIYSTHSPLLISIENFDNLRLLRKEESPERGKPKETKVYWYSRERFKEDLKNFGIISKQKQLKKLSKIINPTINEGFFADKVILVEGWSDQAALEVVAEHKGFELNGNNVSILPVGGKGNLLETYLIFKGFGIFTYLVWDFDKENDERNLELFKALNYQLSENLDDSVVKSEFAILNKNLEDVLRKELGNKNWGVLFSHLQKEQIIRTKEDLKNYTPMRKLIELWYNPPSEIEKHLDKSPEWGLKTLEKIIDTVIGV